MKRKRRNQRFICFSKYHWLFFLTKRRVFFRQNHSIRNSKFSFRSNCFRLWTRNFCFFAFCFFCCVFFFFWSIVFLRTFWIFRVKNKFERYVLKIRICSMCESALIVRRDVVRFYCEKRRTCWHQSWKSNDDDDV